MMDEIIEAIRNQDRAYAVGLLKESHYDFLDLTNKLRYLGMEDEIDNMYQVFIMEKVDK